jgi:hypothetical protein
METPGDVVHVRTTLDDTGERMWAKYLGDDLYEIDNIPFVAYDLHYRDVVRALAQDDQTVPVIVRIVRRSGHKTLRVAFEESTSDAQRSALIARLERDGVIGEKMHGRFYAFSVPPESDYQGVCDLLFGLQKEAVLVYETGVSSEDPSKQAFPSEDPSDRGH